MSSSSIKVAVRCRPLFGQERAASGLDIQNRRILLDSKTYDPDFTFPPTATQADVFQCCRPILQCVKEGMHGTIMVYGQTGTGKTYTMLGSGGDGVDQQHAQQGLVHKVVEHLLEHTQQRAADGAQCALTLSMIEIYNERLTDMLSPDGEAEVTLISGFPRFTHKVALCGVCDAIETIQQGLAWRHTATTLMNERSSRSHVVFIFDLEEYNEFTEQAEVAHLFMIDLAGSESLKKSQASGVVAGEAGKINRSLLALKSVLLALSNTNEATRPSHVPYRDSKLTELLQDSIGGTARTLMIACISSVGRDIEETKSTLLYAVKARSIRNAANTEKEKLLVRLRSMEVENQKLRNRLQERVSERGGYYVTKEEHEQTQEMTEDYEKLKEAVEQLMQDRQGSDARRHIGESQVKMLRALLEEKEEALQRFQKVYHDALNRFEGQASTLQRMVFRGVAEAKDAVQSSFVDGYSRLHMWRTELIAALEAPLPSSLPPSPRPPPAPETAMVAAAASAKQEDEEEVMTESRLSHGGDGSSCANLKHIPAEDIASAPQRHCGVSLNPPAVEGVTAPLTLSTLPPTGSRNGLAPPGSPSRLVGRPRNSGFSHSVCGNTTSSLQHGGVTSGAPSTSVSPTRRGARSRYGGAAAASLFGTGPRRCLLGDNRDSSAPPVVSPPLAVSAAPPSHVASSLSFGESKSSKEGNDDNDSRRVAASPLVESASASLQLTQQVGPSKAAGSQPVWSTVMAQYDTECLQTVRRLNQAVVAMLDECLQSFNVYRESVERAELMRRREMEEVAQRLRSDVESHLKQLWRSETACARDTQAARNTLEDQLRLKGKMPHVAEAAPLQLVVRNACREVVCHAASVFPCPHTPAYAEAALDDIARKIQRCGSAFAVQSLDPLSSSIVMGSTVPPSAEITTMASSSSTTTPNSSPVVGQTMNAWDGNGGAASPAQIDPVTVSALTAPHAGELISAVKPSSPSEALGNEDGPTHRSTGGTVSRAWRGTVSAPSSQPLSRSARPSTSRRSSALTAVSVNRGRVGTHNNVGVFKRTRSTATTSTTHSSSPARRATIPRRSGR